MLRGPTLGVKCVTNSLSPTIKLSCKGAMLEFYKRLWEIFFKAVTYYSASLIYCLMLYQIWTW